MKILVCASPSDALPGVADDIRSVVNGVEGARLAFTYGEALRLLVGNQFDGVIFSGHSDTSGLHWGEDVIAAGEIGRLLALASVRWLFLNSCSSGKFVDDIRTIVDVAVISTKYEVEDGRASRALQGFLVALQTTGHVGRAVELARLAAPGSEYSYAGNTVPPETTDAELASQKRLDDLDLMVFGDERLGVAGIKENMERLRENIESQRFWTLFNAALTLILIIYEVIRVAR